MLSLIQGFLPSFPSFISGTDKSPGVPSINAMVAVFTLQWLLGRADLPIIAVNEWWSRCGQMKLHVGYFASFLVGFSACTKHDAASDRLTLVSKLAHLKLDPICLYYTAMTIACCPRLHRATQSSDKPAWQLLEPCCYCHFHQCHPACSCTDDGNDGEFEPWREAV